MTGGRRAIGVHLDNAIDIKKKIGREISPCLACSSSIRRTQLSKSVEGSGIDRLMTIPQLWISENIEEIGDVFKSVRMSFSIKDIINIFQS